MSFTYVIPDIHGRSDLLDDGIARIVDHSRGQHATLVTLGDYVDRGADSRGVLDRLVGWRSPNLNLVALKGNHEALMWEACNNLIELNGWLRNGGDKTLISYGQCSEEGYDCRIVPRAHLEWIANLSLMHVDNHRVFVHAAIDPTIPLHQQNQETLLWKRYPARSDTGHGFRHVVHGHHANIEAPIVAKRKTNLDGLAWKTGRLVIGIFDNDRPGGASEFIEIRGQPA